MRETTSYIWIFLVAILVSSTLLGLRTLRNVSTREIMRFEGYLHISNSNSHKWNVTLSIREISGDLKGEFYIENNDDLLKKHVYEVDSVTIRETMLILQISGIDIVLKRSELGEGVANPTWTSYAYREKQCVVLTWYRGKNINSNLLGLDADYYVEIDLIPAFWDDR